MVVVDGHLIFLRGLCGHVWVNMHTLSPLSIHEYMLIRVYTHILQSSELPLSSKLIDHTVGLLLHNVNDVYVNIKYAVIDPDE